MKHGNANISHPSSDARDERTFDPLIHALETVGCASGVHSMQHPEDDLIIDGDSMDAYFLMLNLAQRLAAGDIEIVEKGDTANLKYATNTYKELLRKNYLGR